MSHNMKKCFFFDWKDIVLHLEHGGISLKQTQIGNKLQD